MTAPRRALAWVALAALATAYALGGCGRKDASGDAALAGDGRAGTDASDAARTAVGRACRGDSDCEGLRCTTTLRRLCNGPVRPHTWSAEFPGGWCGPETDLATGNIPGGCPAGSITHTVFVGCDGVPYRYCAPRCSGDADCRAGEGYRCLTEGGFCAPAMFLGETADAGAPDADG